ncbi:hypothetical protein E2C01_060245 [Portunus trituberculatus]|uniref:Uncharacterized protein n=1 Tax=Portunus trituberculatus TaxID=210409 RepID=A0A5B7H4Q1_PORTR|nr:hypothetical protein [Portunus trituberculatus]
MSHSPTQELDHTVPHSSTRVAIPGGSTDTSSLYLPVRNWILPRTRCPPREGSRTSPQQLRITFHRGIGLGGLTSPSTEGLDSAPRDVLPSALYRLPSS